MNRRNFLQLSSAPAAADPTFSEPPSIEPYEGTWSRPEVYHLLRRTLIAPTVTEVGDALAMSRTELVDALLDNVNPQPGPSRFVRECMNASGLGWNGNDVGLTRSFYDELRRWWIGQMANHPLSIRERMTLFWHNHFAVNARTIQDPRLIYLQNQLFRRNAVGNFRELVRLVTIDKAMLFFLDGKFNKARFRNENYARELQELFTIGVADNDGNPNYTQEDVVEVAKTLTGWDWVGFGMQGTVTNNLLTGHDLVDKTVYGEKITARTEGAPELTRLLDIIFAKEETARYVIRKLYRFFVYTDVTLTPVRPIAEEIESGIIAPLATIFRDNDWDIRPVLRTLLLSRHFYDTAVRAATIKSPVDLMAGTIRATLSAPLTGDNLDFATQYAQLRSTEIQQNLNHPPGVQGWSFYRSWISSTTLPKRRFFTDAMLAGAESRIVDRLNMVFTGPIPRNGSWRIDLLAFAKQFGSYEDPELLVADIAEHLLAFAPTTSLTDRLLDEMTNGRPYEWEELDDPSREAGLAKMLRYLMRSSNYQLM